MNTNDINNSNIKSVQYVEKVKKDIEDYVDLIVQNPIFSMYSNSEDLKKLLIQILNDLYIEQPIDIINFLNNVPNKKLVDTIYKNFGIDDELIKKIPENLKTTLAYKLSILYEKKGSDEVYNLFNEVLEEFFNNLNFYNIVIEQRQLKSPYEQPTTIHCYYVDEYDVIRGDLGYGNVDQEVFIDKNIEFKVFTVIHEQLSQVEYHVKFFEKLKYKTKLKLSNTESVILPEGLLEHTFKINVDNIITYSNRNVNELVYKLKPVIINDPASQLYEISPSDLRTSKYLMTPIDFFDMDNKNLHAKNIFPINTNVLYIQFETSGTVDEMIYLLDLIRLFACTTLQHNSFTFEVQGVITKLPFQYYMDMLMYLKLKELQFKHPDRDYTNSVYNKRYVTYIHHMSDLSEISNLLIFYKEMKHDHEQFQEFKRRFFKLIYKKEQYNIDEIETLPVFEEFLKGNIPENFDDFWLKVEKAFPIGENIIEGYDQNKLIRNELRRLYEVFKPETVPDFYEIISIHEQEIYGLNSKVYDSLIRKFNSRFPRLINKINSLNNVEQFVETFLLNYKRILVQIQKEDNLITYFFNDVYKRLIFGESFHEHFFDPIYNIFAKYFFKAEQSYQNLSQVSEKIRNKMQMVTTGDKNFQEVNYSGDWGEFFIGDDSNYDVRSKFVKNYNINDDREIQVRNDATYDKIKTPITKNDYEVDTVFDDKPHLLIDIFRVLEKSEFSTKYNINNKETFEASLDVNEIVSKLNKPKDKNLKNISLDKIENIRHNTNDKQSLSLQNSNNISKEYINDNINVISDPHEFEKISKNYNDDNTINSNADFNDKRLGYDDNFIISIDNGDEIVKFTTNNDDEYNNNN